LGEKVVSEGKKRTKARAEKAKGQIKSGLKKRVRKL
jgi:hypothetical protein